MQAELDDWEQWGKDEQFSIKVEPSTPPSDLPPSGGEVDLFQDMQPVFQKAKKVIEFVISECFGEPYGHSMLCFFVLIDSSQEKRD